MFFFAGRKNPCKGVWIFRAREAKTMQKVHGFFCRTKNYAKTAWFFLPDEKTHAKVYGFFEPERLKPCEKCMGFFAG
jgi:hypothetical protein